jgi:hypothetical protein
MLFQKRINPLQINRGAKRQADLRLLRETEDKRSGDWTQIIARLAQAMAHLFTLPSGGMNHVMCKNYGHVIHNFGHGLPRCGECGAEIKHTSQIRTSSLLKSREGTGFEITL